MRHSLIFLSIIFCLTFIANAKQNKDLTDLSRKIKGTKAAQKHPKWGIHGSSATEIEEQLTFENFNVNEDYCGESCQVYTETN